MFSYRERERALSFHNPILNVLKCDSVHSFICLFKMGVREYSSGKIYNKKKIREEKNSQTLKNLYRSSTLAINFIPYHVTEHCWELSVGGTSSGKIYIFFIRSKFPSFYSGQCILINVFIWNDLHPFFYLFIFCVRVVVGGRYTPNMIQFYAKENHFDDTRFVFVICFFVFFVNPSIVQWVFNRVLLSIDFIFISKEVYVKKVERRRGY